MPKISYSTDAPAFARFRAHGTIRLEMDGHRLRTTATGPFNAEALAAVAELEAQVFARMKAAGKWVEILEFRHNLLATAEALEAFARHVERFRSKGLSPLGSAVVIDPSLEGEAIIRPQLAAAYAAAGWPCAFFTHMADAEAWADSLLDVTEPTR